jgi:transcriptional regulator with XRE-family HTH domain
MTSRGALLRDVLQESGVSQSELARLSGMHQPSISQVLSGRTDLSDTQLDRLLSCLGYRLEVIRRPVRPELTRAERRSWRLHRVLSSQLTAHTLAEWAPSMRSNLDTLLTRVTGQPHERNLHRWRELLDERDVLALHRVLTGLDRDDIEMREVSPMAGLLSEDDRLRALAEPD